MQKMASSTKYKIFASAKTWDLIYPPEPINNICWSADIVTSGFADTTRVTADMVGCIPEYGKIITSYLASSTEWTADAFEFSVDKTE